MEFERNSGSLSYEVYVKRTIFPLLPSRTQLLATIEQGDDRISNSLILNVYGFFELRARETINLMIKDPTIIFRNETYDAGNGYVGKEAANDTESIDALYVDALSYWLKHLQKGKIDYYSDTHTHEVLSELLKAIEIKKQEFEAAEEEDSYE